jgi:hypothetical protein
VASRCVHCSADAAVGTRATAAAGPPETWPVCRSSVGAWPAPCGTKVRVVLTLAGCPAHRGDLVGRRADHRQDAFLFSACEQELAECVHVCAFMRHRASLLEVVLRPVGAKQMTVGRSWHGSPSGALRAPSLHRLIWSAHHSEGLERAAVGEVVGVCETSDHEGIATGLGGLVGEPVARIDQVEIAAGDHRAVA